MGGFLQNIECSDLTLGKPTLFPLPATATITQTLKALRYSEDTAVLSVWIESDATELQVHECRGTEERHRCGVLVTMMDLICFLAKDENIFNPKAALSTPISFLLPSLSSAVAQVHTHTSLQDGMDLMLDGVQALVVPTVRRGHQVRPTRLPGKLESTALSLRDYCWITQEDVVRYLLGSIGAFYPLPMMSLKDLDLIRTDILMVDRTSPASYAIRLMQRASQEMLGVAVVSGLSSNKEQSSESDTDEVPKLVGEISASTLRGCNEAAAPALATLAVNDFLSYVSHVGGPPRHLIDRVRIKLQQNLAAKINSLGLITSHYSPKTLSPVLSTKCFTSVSEDAGEDEISRLRAGMLDNSCGASFEGSLRKLTRTGSLSKNRSAFTPITCRPASSLVAVMAQALAYRVNYVWVTDEEDGLIGVVTFADIIDVLLSHLKAL